MTSLTKHETARWLLLRDDFLILTHRRPDGDTLGSAAALCLGLRQLGKTAHILENPEITAAYRSLHQGLTVTQAQAQHCLICVDVAAADLLPGSFRCLENRLSLRIDHHRSSESFTPLELVEPQAGACGDIIYDLLMLMGAKLDHPLAEALYTAVSTDTGCFRYANTTAHSYRVAAACAETGANLNAISQALFDTVSLARLRLQGWITENLWQYAGGQAVVCALPRSVEQALGVTEDDMENISGFPRSIQGVKIAATLRQNADGRLKLSVRAVPGYDAAAICAQFGGGGHRGAAGATLEMPLEEAAEALGKAMEEAMNA